MNAKNPGGPSSRVLLPVHTWRKHLVAYYTG
jgi:hypothetical protein